jgi:hypothetical protein
VASYPTAADARAYFDSWVTFYQDFYQFPADLPVDIGHGFDTYKVTYCTVDVARPGTARPVPRVATGNVSVPATRDGSPPSPTSTALAVSFYDASSNPNVFGEFEEQGESFDGPPSSAIFAGAGSSTSPPTTSARVTRPCPAIATSTPPPRRRRPSTCSRPPTRCCRSRTPAW